MGGQAAGVGDTRHTGRGVGIAQAQFTLEHLDSASARGQWPAAWD